jgi:hypothetical protein
MRARCLLVLAAALALAGCQDLFNGLVGNAAPTGVSASDGDYANQVYVSWTAPSLTGDTWKDYTVSNYRVSWTGPTAGWDYAAGTSYAISVIDADRAKKFTVTVESRLSLGGAPAVSGGSASDTGFALDATDLIWYDGGRDYTVSGTDAWYVTMLQKGFKYSFDISSGGGTVEFYPYKSLDIVHATSDIGAIQSWTCDDSGAGHKFYVHITPSAAGASFHASYGF